MPQNLQIIYHLKLLFWKTLSHNPDPVVIVQESFQPSQHQCQHEGKESKTGDVASVSASVPCKAGTLQKEVKAHLPKKKESVNRGCSETTD